ncbi:hypothetical protein SERLA73DRAFT_69028 [Serpula lacrymans var. lacrymans S7.3]|uniref:Uncharacterized protein n=1 Tax=Serpula lacrymans var. lacrymans (strain S7.3) TaxID=936435 RepID=F8PGI0_SERL3|nr:hypothetical protein SERLA73DRAFT_69028 [Serpula lacrymans var. lacrymans S7.3]
MRTTSGRVGPSGSGDGTMRVWIDGMMMITTGRMDGGWGGRFHNAPPPTLSPPSSTFFKVVGAKNRSRARDKTVSNDGFWLSLARSFFMTIEKEKEGAHPPLWGARSHIFTMLPSRH